MAVTADEALVRLREGNARYVSGEHVLLGAANEVRRRQVAHVQAPFAAVLGCADSRVPVELVFDQGLGDVFVVRVAGHVVGPTTVGSLEFAAQVLGVRLVLVLGHTRCGAVEAALREGLELPRALGDLVSRVRSAAATRREAEPDAGEGEILDAAVVDHVDDTVAQLRGVSPVLARLARDDGLAVVGATFDLDTGRVRFHDAV